MHRDDDEQNLKAAFAELHRRECVDAPPFEAMRQCAMRGDGSPHTFRRLLWGAPAAGCVAAFLLWVGGRFSAPAPLDFRERGAAQRVEQLLNSIEHQLDVREPIPSAVYPTDALLSQTDTDPLQ